MDSHPSEAIELPRVLLLDETDATLHPSMIKTLLHVLDDSFRQRDVKVILATHAPTTVALAPEESIYTMRREGSPRIRHVSRDEALSGLMAGLPTLSVSNEYRRVVFVEGLNDQLCYQEVFRVLDLPSPIALEFIASGRGGQGDTGVVRLVEELRERGSDVYGVVDRDNRQGAPDGIAFSDTRYTLENLVLDPVAVAIFLIRKKSVKTETIFGIRTPLHKLAQEHAQTMCDFVVTKVVARIPQVKLAQYDSSPVVVHYEGGAEAEVPKYVLDMPGHDWERFLSLAFPSLEHLFNSGKLVPSVITDAMVEYEEWIPCDFRALFEDLLARIPTNPDTQGTGPRG